MLSHLFSTPTCIDDPRGCNTELQEYPNIFYVYIYTSLNMRLQFAYLCDRVCVCVYLSEFVYVWERVWTFLMLKLGLYDFKL